MSDLIRREDLVKELNAQFAVGDITREIANDILHHIPTAEPERKWIPFEVALPNDRQKVLCVNKHDEMMVGGYMSDYGMTFPCYFEKPIAWMPLPEPMRGEE